MCVVARSYAPEFRRRVVVFVREGRAVSVVAAVLGVSEATVYAGESRTGSTAGAAWVVECGEGRARGANGCEGWSARSTPTHAGSTVSGGSGPSCAWAGRPTVAKPVLD